MSQRSIFVLFQGETCVLSDLILEDCHIDDKLLESLLKARHMSTGLQHLNLSCNNIGKNGIPLLARLVLACGEQMLFSALVSPAACETRAEKSVCSPQARLVLQTFVFLFYEHVLG